MFPYLKTLASFGPLMRIGTVETVDKSLELVSRPLFDANDTPFLPLVVHRHFFFFFTWMGAVLQ